MAVFEATGKMPTYSYLGSIGQYGLAVQIKRTGGLIKWAKKLGIVKEKSESEKGWSGESEVARIIESHGFKVQPAGVLAAPFDLLVDGFLKLDVKAAKHATYGPCSGWFFRIGKVPQADLMALFQSDTKDIYFIPWHIVPTTNVTISATGGIYRDFKNRFDLVKSMADLRRTEAEGLTEDVP